NMCSIENDDRSRLGRIVASNSTRKGCAISSWEIQPRVSNAFAQDAFRSLDLTLCASVPASVMLLLCRRVESKSTTFSALPCQTAINSITLQDFSELSVSSLRRSKYGDLPQPNRSVSRNPHLH